MTEPSNARIRMTWACSYWCMAKVFTSSPAAGVVHGGGIEEDLNWSGGQPMI